MPFVVHGRDARTGAVAKHRVSDAQTAEAARAEAARLGVVATAILPLPELHLVPPSARAEAHSAARRAAAQARA
ncbi:MAG: hypothetical protein ABI846_11465, partial [Rudaea sp.]